MVKYTLWLILLVLELLLVSVLWAGNTHAPTGDVSTEQRAWWGDALSGGYVVQAPAGLCQHGTSGTTSATMSICRMYTANSGPPRQLEYIEDLGLRTIQYTAGNGTYWLIAHAAINIAVTGWQRVEGTHYLWRQLPTQPSLPDRAGWLLSATVSGAAITAVQDLRTVGSPITGTFIGLGDTPASYAGHALQGVRVNAAEDALEFSTEMSGGGTDIYINGVAIATSANFVDTGDVLFSRTPGTPPAPDNVSATLKPDSVGPNQLADVDFGHFTCNDAGAGCTLDAGVVTSTAIAAGTIQGFDLAPGSVSTTALSNSSITANKMANADHGDVSWTGGVAKVENVQCSNCISDAEVDDTLTASNYLPLSGGTLTGPLTTAIAGITFPASDTNPPCTPGLYTIFADADESSLQVCNNGQIFLVAQGAVTLEGARQNDPVDNSATSAAVAPQWGGDTSRIRIYEDPSLGATIEAFIVATGVVLTFDEIIYNGDPKRTLLHNAGARDVCLTLDDTGLQTYSAVENCGKLAGTVTMTGPLVTNSSVTATGGAIDFGAATSLEVPNSATPTTTVFGQLAADSNAWAASRGALQVYDGTSNTYVVATQTTPPPQAGQVPTFNTGGTVTWQTPTVSGAIDTVLVLFHCNKATTTTITHLLVHDDVDGSCLGDEDGGGNKKTELMLPWNAVADSMICDAVTAPGVGQSVTLTVRFNALDTNLSVQMVGTTTGPVSDTGGTSNYTAGQRITVRNVATAGATPAGFINCSIVMRRT